MAKEKVEEQPTFKVVQVATATETVIVNTDEEHKSLHEVIAEMANDIKTLKKHLVG